MEINNRPDTVTITLTRSEANTLRTELLNLFVLSHDGIPPNVLDTLWKGLIDGMAEPTVSKEEAATAIGDVANQCRQRARTEADPTLKEMYLSDAKDLGNIAVLVRLGSYSSAKDLTARLDTAVRDEIPECAWPFVGLRPLR